jgi:hypothetical protein
VSHETTNHGYGQGEPGSDQPAQDNAEAGKQHDGAGVVKTALTVAGGSAAGMTGIVVAAGTAAIGTVTACFAIASFGVIMLASLGVAAAYALRR